MMAKESIDARTRYFTLPLLDLPWPIGRQPTRPCPICNETWQPTGGSRLPCHGKCLWTEEGAVFIANDPRIEAKLVDELGVNRSMLRIGKGIGNRIMAEAAKATANDDDDDESMTGIDKSQRCDALNCALIKGHERQLTCRMRISAVSRGELQWLWHEPGCSLEPDHADVCTWNGHATCGIGRVRAACKFHYGHDGSCSPDRCGTGVGAGLTRITCSLSKNHIGPCKPS